MKTNLVRQCSLIVVAGLTMSLGCARPSAQTEQPKTLAAPTTVVVPPLEPVAPGTNAVATADIGPKATAETNAPAILERIAPAGQPEAVALSPGLAEIAKLAQAGVGEEVILAYVEKYEGRFDVGADQIVYLNDLGVSGAVITSILKHDGSPETAATLTNPPPSVVQTQVVSNVPQNQLLPSYAAPEQAAPEQPAPEVTTQVAPPPSSAEVSYFYDTLSPYGSWVYVAGYGWCWQPTVAVSIPTWRPYVDRGRWYWSDAGWYWASDYSWGWAPFHYGRWYHHPHSGWLWTPGTVWGPSWVSWRYSAGYCGWAPLPPEAYFVSGVGFTFHSRHVSIGFDFGLSDFHYSFVHVNNFCDYSPYRYVLPHAHVRNFYRNTTVINNYIVGNNNTVINRGIGRETIARSSQTRIREVAVRDRPVQNVSRIRGDQIERQGNQLVAYRPQLPKEPPQIRTAQFASRTGGGQSRQTAIGRTGSAVRNEGSGAASLSGNNALPATGGRVPASVRARPARETTAETEALQPNRREQQNGRAAVSPRHDNGTATASTGSRAVGNGTTVADNRPRQAQPNSAAAAQAQAQYQRQQQLRNGPLFGSSVSGGAAQPAANPAGRRSAEGRNNSVAGPRAQLGPPTPVYPEGQRQVHASPQNSAAAARAADPRSAVQHVAPRVQPAPQSSAQYNGAISRPGARVYPQTPVQAPAAQFDRNNIGAGRTVSPRQSEQSPRYSAPPQHVPQYSAPAAREYSAPRQESRPAPAAPSGGGHRGGGGGGGGGREASAGRAERGR